MGDSQFFEKRMRPPNRRDYAVEQIKSKLSDLPRTQSPPPGMRDNPFKARRLFCPINEGSPTIPQPEQIKTQAASARENARIRQSALLQVDVTILQQIDGNPPQTQRVLRSIADLQRRRRRSMGQQMLRFKPARD
jgi:hypothetical protein